MSGIIRQVSQAISAIPGLGSPRARLFVIACCAIGAVAGGVWAVMFPGNWVANQSLVVRDDLLGDSFKPGKFNSPESMKSAQETIFHIARKPEVIRAAVRNSGQPQELSSEDIEIFQRWISIVAPNGGEFGKTEVFVLRVREKSPELAEQLIRALATEIELNLRLVRSKLMASMQNELKSGVERTSEHYDVLVQEIQKVEQSVGSDLASLRGLIDPNSGAGDLQRSLEQIRLEIRAAQSDRERVAKQLELLRLAKQQTSGEYLTTSNELLELQPALKRLNDGLVDARLAQSVAMGKYDSGHPIVENAKTAAAKTMEQIRSVLDSTELGLTSQLGLYDQKVARLSGDEQVCAQRLIDIGKLRVTYKSLSDELTKRGEALAKTRTELAEIQALAESADDVNLITRIGDPQLGTRPDGISKRAMVMAGFFGGLMIGLGLVVLNAGPVNFPVWVMAKGEGQQSARENQGAPGSTAKPRTRSAKPQPPTTDDDRAIGSLQTKFEQAFDSWSIKQLEEPGPATASKTLQSVKTAPANPPPAKEPAAPQPPAKQSVAATPVATKPVANNPVVAQAPAAQAQAASPVVSAPVPKVEPPKPEPTRGSGPQSPELAKWNQARELDRARHPSSQPAPPSAAVPSAPGPLVPNPSGRPGQVLKKMEAEANADRQIAKLGTADSTSRSGGLTSEEIGRMIPKGSASPDRDNSRNRSQSNDGSRRSSGTADLPGAPGSQIQPDLAQQSPSVPGPDKSPAVPDNQTVSLADLQIQRIRQQLEELDPTLSFDVFCQDVRKDIPPQAGNV